MGRLGGIAIAVLLGIGCASGNDPNPRGGDGGQGSDAGCHPACPTGQMCALGTCVPVVDADMDGLDASVDCDDGDPLIGSTAQRSCSSACGAGLERCTGGTWAACDAPTACGCGPTPACSPGQVDTGMQSCSGCGTQTRTRTCDSTCTWGPWSAWGACTGGGGTCMPGQVQTGTQACGNCGTGTQSRTRTCDASCGWGAWSAWDACVGGGACAPGDTMPCPNGDVCGVQTCGATCTWDATCVPNPGSDCLRIRPGTTGPAGNNYRCCTVPAPTTDPTGWQFCLPPDAAGHCFWSSACDPTTAC